MNPSVKISDTRTLELFTKEWILNVPLVAPNATLIATDRGSHSEESPATAIFNFIQQTPILREAYEAHLGLYFNQELTSFFSAIQRYGIRLRYAQANNFLALAHLNLIWWPRVFVPFCQTCPLERIPLSYFRAHYPKFQECGSLPIHAFFNANHIISKLDIDFTQCHEELTRDLIRHLAKSGKATLGALTYYRLLMDAPYACMRDLSGQFDENLRPSPHTFPYGYTQPQDCSHHECMAFYDKFPEANLERI